MTSPQLPDGADPKKFAEDMWRAFLTGTQPPFQLLTPLERLLVAPPLLRQLPSEPRCRICYTPFAGIGGQLLRAVLGRERSKLNPQMCNACEKFAQAFPGGAEVEISMLFADVRGSTTLAEGLTPAVFSQLIDRFYQAATHVLVHSNAMIEKLIGDEVVGLFAPGLAGPHHAEQALEAARKILHETGHDKPGGPWIPVGVGIHTGLVYIGSVGQADGMRDIAALGDAVNVAARIASKAGAGEVLVSEAARAQSNLPLTALEKRQLQLKGKSELVEVWVVPAGGDPH